MAWPPSYSSAFIGAGSTTIKWGTDGMLANSSPNGSGGGVGGFYTVESCRPADEIENIYIEQGSGLKATRIQLWQGRRIIFTIVDDTNFTPPGPNTKLSSIDPLSGFTLTFSVVDNGGSTARKVEAKREVTAEYLTLIEGAGSVPPT